MRGLIALGFMVLMLLLPAGAKKLTHGFRLAKLKFEYAYKQEWEVPISSEILSILDQPFFYLDKGSQCYVFESLDKNYVIKLFRCDFSEKHQKIETLFSACKIAFDQLSAETGLIYIHLNETRLNLPKVQFRDAVGRRYSLPLDRFRFALQKKAKLLREEFLACRNDPTKMQKRIDQFLALLKIRTEKGIFNTDPTLGRNFGFLDEKAIEIDFGNYRPSSNLSKSSEVLRYTDRLRRFLSLQIPEWVPYLDAQLEAM